MLRWRNNEETFILHLAGSTEECCDFFIFSDALTGKYLKYGWRKWYWSLKGEIRELNPFIQFYWIQNRHLVQFGQNSVVPSDIRSRELWVQRQEERKQPCLGLSGFQVSGCKYSDLIDSARVNLSWVDSIRPLIHSHISTSSIACFNKTIIQ